MDSIVHSTAHTAEKNATIIICDGNSTQMLSASLYECSDFLLQVFAGGWEIVMNKSMGSFA